ncbi:MAG TPA: glycerophosphodiester phosphodiesterase family protein [Casimicrobiaceae bacterium]
MVHNRLPCLPIAVLALASAASIANAFDLEGHRGARGLAPENTMAALRKGLSIGVTTIETDMAITKDGVVVIAHDRDLNPAIARDASGQWLSARGPAIRTLTLSELRTYDIGRVNPDSDYGRQFPLQLASDGERYPTLDDLIALVKPTTVRIDIVKADASGRSPWHAGLVLVDYGGSMPKLVQAAGCAVWSAQARSLSRDRIDDAHALKLKVLAWTVNDRAEMARLIDLGVDGLITDYPDRLAKLLEEKGIAWR